MFVAKTKNTITNKRLAAYEQVRCLFVAKNWALLCARSAQRDTKHAHSFRKKQWSNGYTTNKR